MFYKYVEFIKNHEKYFVIFFIFFNLFFIVGTILKIDIDSDFIMYSINNSKSQKSFDEMIEKFSDDEQLIFLISVKNKLNKAEDFIKLHEIHNYFQNLKDVSYVMSPVPDTIYINKKSKNIKEINDDDIPLLFESYEQLGDLNPLIKKDNNFYAIYTLFLDKSNSNIFLINKAAKFLKSNNYDYYISGELYLKKKILDYVFLLSFFLSILAFILLLVFFRVHLGNFKAAFYSVISALMGIIWLIGTMAWFGIKISISTAIAPMFVFVIGSADGLHFVSHFIEEKCHKAVPILEGVSNTLQRVGLPMIMTTITTVVGFLSLLTINSSGLNEFVILSAVGMIYSGIITWLLLPLLFFHSKECTRKIIFLEKTLSKAKKIWGFPSIILTVVLLLIFIPGIFIIKKNFTLISFFNKRTEVYKNLTKVDELTNGSIPLYLLLKTDKDILDKSNADKTFELEKELKEANLISKSVSIYHIITGLNTTIGKNKNFVYPDNKIMTSFIYSMIKTRSKQLIENLINKKENYSRIFLFPINFNNNTIDKIEKIINNHQSENMKFSIAGLQYTFKETNESITSKQFETLIVALIFVFILLLIIYKKINISIISILPLSITLIIMFGFLGLAKIPLSSFIALLIGIVIGVSNDYAIHYTSLFMYYKKLGSNTKEATEKALKITSQPIFINAFGIACGLSALFFSPITFHIHLALVIWVTMASSSILSLTLIPTLLRKFIK